jgi:hypothetical protein
MVATESVVAICTIHHLAMVATRNLAMVVAGSGRVCEPVVGPSTP